MKRPPRPGEEIFTLLGAWTRFVDFQRFYRFDEGVTWSRSDSVELRAMIAAQALIR